MKKLLAAVMLAALTLTGADAVPIAFEDVDCNGFYEPGVDNVINPGPPGSPPTDLFIDSPYCLVIPRGSLSTQAWNSLFINAEGDVTIGAILTTTTKPSSDGAGWIKGGTLTIAPGTRFTSAGQMYVGSNSGRLVIGDSVAIKSKKNYNDVIAYNGDVLVGKGVIIESYDFSNLSAPKGRINAGIGGLKVTSLKGSVNIRARDSITIVGATIKALDYVNIETPATPLTFKTSRVLFSDPANAFGNIISMIFTNPCCPKGPVNVTGSTIPASVFVGGDPITGN